MLVKAVGDDDANTTNDGNGEQYNWMMFGFVMFSALGFWIILTVMLWGGPCRRHSTADADGETGCDAE